MLAAVAIVPPVEIISSRITAVEPLTLTGPEEVSTVLGFPDWVFRGVVLPWMIANIFTFWFCLRFLKNDEDEEEAP